MPRALRRDTRYRDRRDFRNPPRGAAGEWPGDNPIFVIQKHAASHLHYDLRVEVGGVLKSWAVPKGPSLDPADKRLAVKVEDHALEYADFEGVIQEGHYGAGAVIVWDAGPYRNLARDKSGRELPMSEAIERGRIEIWLEGRKIRGGYALVRTRMAGRKPNWLLIKMNDECADTRLHPVETEPESVLTGRTVEEVGARADAD
jgi:DNA ligase D-like protein (predicted 3'-phosphoesterase)